MRTLVFRKAEPAPARTLPVCRPLIQPKLMVGAPDDQYEREADRIADDVTATGQLPSALSGHDFGRIRIHADARAAEAAESLNARAFTIGSDVYFGAGEYRPETEPGQRLLTHELAHVVQQARTPALSSRVLPWLAEDHDRLSQAAIEADFSEEFSDGARQWLAHSSGQMDIRGCNYVWFGSGKLEGVPVLSPAMGVVSEALDSIEAANHGEANLYRYTDRTPENEARADSYLRDAVAETNRAGAERERLRVGLARLGDALHVAQDRGAHGEGLPGQGHARQDSDPTGEFRADSFVANSEGKNKALDLSKSVLRAYLDALAAAPRDALRSAGDFLSRTDTAVAVAPTGELAWLSYRLRGILPGARLGGIIPYAYSAGLVATQDAETIAASAEIGLQVLRIGDVSANLLVGAGVMTGPGDLLPMPAASAAVTAETLSGYGAEARVFVDPDGRLFWTFGAGARW